MHQQQEEQQRQQQQQQQRCCNTPATWLRRNPVAPERCVWVHSICFEWKWNYRIINYERPRPREPKAQQEAVRVGEAGGAQDADADKSC